MRTTDVLKRGHADAAEYAHPLWLRALLCVAAALSRFAAGYIVALLKERVPKLPGLAVE